MTIRYKCLDCEFECYKVETAKTHMQVQNHQLTHVGQKNIVEEVKEPRVKVLEPRVKVKDSREDWKPGVMVTRRAWGYEVTLWGADIGIYDTLQEALDSASHA